MNLNYYPVYYPKRTPRGYYFKIFRLADDEAIFTSATYPTMKEAMKTAEAVIAEYERINA